MVLFLDAGVDDDADDGDDGYDDQDNIKPAAEPPSGVDATVPIFAAVAVVTGGVRLRIGFQAD